MARGKKDAAATNSNRTFQQTQFVDIPVVEQDWQEVQKVYGSPDAIVDSITDLLDAGYRVGLSFNSNNDAFICSITCRNPDSENNGYTFNAFAETWLEAMQLAAYKHFIKSGQKWLSQGGKASRPKFG